MSQGRSQLTGSGIILSQHGSEGRWAQVHKVFWRPESFGMSIAQKDGLVASTEEQGLLEDVSPNFYNT